MDSVKVYYITNVNISEKYQGMNSETKNHTKADDKTGKNKIHYYYTHCEICRNAFEFKMLWH
jgi:hypothetical protein